MNEDVKRLSMEDFNRICLDCGLVPNEEKNKYYNNEASYFSRVHPVSKKPVEVAYYEDFIDDDDTYLYVGAHGVGSILEKDYCQFSTSYLRIKESELRTSIEKVKKLLDEELEARKSTNVPLHSLADFLAHADIDTKKVSVELSVPFQEFIDKLSESPVIKIKID